NDDKVEPEGNIIVPPELSNSIPKTHFTFQFKFDSRLPVNITLYWGTRKKEFKKYIKYRQTASNGSDFTSILQKYTSKISPLFKLFKRIRRREKSKAEGEEHHEETLINDKDDDDYSV